MLSLADLLSLKGLDCSRPKSIKLVRHKDKRVDVEALRRGGHIETYQRIQGSPIFNCDYVVSFMGMDGTQARLLGVYRVGAHRQVQPADIADLPRRHIVGDADPRHQRRTQARHPRLRREPGGGRGERHRRAPNKKNPRYARYQGFFQSGSGGRI
ncbi:MAG: hypothetical protein PHQ53_09835 [Candidatus Krumholzibacteria bacterium]|nr:hypothetical protein [Candidatus Krumholzibacteria bacterium]